MRRRRLVLATALLALPAGVVLWWNAGRLSADEELFVGTWSYPVSPSNPFWPAGGTIFSQYGRDRTCRVYGIDGRY